MPAISAVCVSAPANLWGAFSNRLLPENPERPSTPHSLSCTSWKPSWELEDTLAGARVLGNVEIKQHVQAPSDRLAIRPGARRPQSAVRHADQ